MKKQISFLVVLFFCFGLVKLQAQQPFFSNKDSIKNKTQLNYARIVNDIKTCNWQDVLANFFQVGLSDFTGKNRAFNFKSSLFGLKLKTNSNLNIDTQYVKRSFDRNFQFALSLGIDSSYRLNGYSAGFTWAAINKRDLTVMRLIETSIDSIWMVGSEELSTSFVQYRFKKYSLKTPQDSADVKKVKQLVDSMTMVGQFSAEGFPPDFDITKIQKTLNGVYNAYDLAKKNTLQKPLLTISFNTAFKKQASFDSLQFGFVFLQGLTKKGKPLELDLRASLNIKDTLIQQSKYRAVLNSSGGLNCALITNSKTNGSILEFKPYIEYNRIFSGLLPGENRDQFLASMDFRLKVTQHVWIPIAIKYDIKTSNFLGFLNVNANLNAVKSFLKSSLN
jgi:hypothetical protein